MAWCKLSSLIAAVVRVLKEASFPLTRAQILSLTAGKNVEGWELHYFLTRSLKKGKYADFRAVMRDLEDWLEAQG
ncbi:MAG TPA: hypothetical protein VIW22_02380 [Nitrososphaerales archaeon]